MTSKMSISCFRRADFGNILLLLEEILRRFPKKMRRTLCRRARHEGRGCILQLFVTLVWKLANYSICGIIPDLFLVR